MRETLPDVDRCIESHQKRFVARMHAADEGRCGRLRCLYARFHTCTGVEDQAYRDGDIGIAREMRDLLSSATEFDDEVFGFEIGDEFPVIVGHCGGHLLQRDVDLDGLSLFGSGLADQG